MKKFYLLIIFINFAQMSFCQDITLSAKKDTSFLNISEIVLDNPFSGDTYPICFSVIYHDRLITLFEPGKFCCYNLITYKRDTLLEKKLNTKTFVQHWVIDNQLIAKTDWELDLVFSEEKQKWVKYKKRLPFENQSKMYEDSVYIVYSECNGEFGGKIYFYNRKSKKTHFTYATCANSVSYQEDGYFVLSHSMHGVGSTDLQYIKNPENLTLCNSNGNDIDSNKYSKTLFDISWKQLISHFQIKDKWYYLLLEENTIWLANMTGTEIKKIEPIVNFYTHDPITQKYGDRVLMNLDFYGTARKREIKLFIFENNKLTILDWNKKHYR